jgi:septation ring formation regulator EzrA
MSIEVTILISVVSVAFAIYFGIKSNRRNDTKDIEERVARETRIDVKLDSISGDVKDIKEEMALSKKQYSELDRRVIKVEEASKSAHHRLDGIMKQGGFTDVRRSEE